VQTGWRITQNEVRCQAENLMRLAAGWSYANLTILLLVLPCCYDFVIWAFYLLCSGYIFLLFFYIAVLSSEPGTVPFHIHDH